MTARNETDRRTDADQDRRESVRTASGCAWRPGFHPVSDQAPVNLELLYGGTRTKPPIRPDEIVVLEARPA